MTTDEKDRMKDEAVAAYQRAYVARGVKTSAAESFFVMKGIEAMAAIAFKHIDQMGLDHEDALVEARASGYAEGEDAVERTLL